jgi:hypothetical protein
MESRVWMESRVILEVDAFKQSGNRIPVKRPKVSPGRYFNVNRLLYGNSVGFVGYCTGGSGHRAETSALRVAL